jgi:hypothetical protein
VNRSEHDGGDMADEGTLEERFLKELYGLANAQATRVVSGAYAA